MIRRVSFGGEGGIRTHVPLTAKRFSRPLRYDRFGTSPYLIDFRDKVSTTLVPSPQAALTSTDFSANRRPRLVENDVPCPCYV